MIGILVVVILSLVVLGYFARTYLAREKFNDIQQFADSIEEGLGRSLVKKVQETSQNNVSSASGNIVVIGVSHIVKLYPDNRLSQQAIQRNLSIPQSIQSLFPVTKKYGGVFVPGIGNMMYTVQTKQVGVPVSSVSWKSYSSRQKAVFCKLFCQSLLRLGQANFCHRDLHPDNVFVQFATSNTPLGVRFIDADLSVIGENQEKCDRFPLEMPKVLASFIAAQAGREDAISIGLWHIYCDLNLGQAFNVDVRYALSTMASVVSPAILPLVPASDEKAFLGKFVDDDNQIQVTTNFEIVLAQRLGSADSVASQALQHIVGIPVSLSIGPGVQWDGIQILAKVMQTTPATYAAQIIQPYLSWSDIRVSVDVPDQLLNPSETGGFSARTSAGPLNILIRQNNEGSISLFFSRPIVVTAWYLPFSAVSVTGIDIVFSPFYTQYEPRGEVKVTGLNTGSAPLSYAIIKVDKGPLPTRAEFKETLASITSLLADSLLQRASTAKMETTTEGGVYQLGVSKQKSVVKMTLDTVSSYSIPLVQPISSPNTGSYILVLLAAFLLSLFLVVLV